MADFLKLLCGVVYLTCCVSAHAESGDVVALPSAPFSAPGADTLAVDLGGDSSATQLKVVDQQSITVPVFDQHGNQTSQISAVVRSVSDANASAPVTGTLVELKNQPEQGVYGVLNQSGTETEWKIEPAGSAASGTTLHTVTRVEGNASADTDSCDGELSLHSPLKRREYSALLQQRTAAYQQSGAATGQAAAQAETWRAIDVIVVAPGDFTQGRTESAVVAQIISTIAGANVYYEPLGLVIKLAGVQLYSGGPSDPYALPVSRRDALGMLETVRFEWNTRNLPPHDVVAVFARSSFSGVFGYAYPSASCIAPEFSFLFATQGRSDAGGELGLISTFAHELGHIIGMTHDTTFGPGGPSMMWQFFVLQPTGFSDFSIGEFEKHEANGGAACFAATDDPFMSEGEPPPKDPTAPFGFTAETLAPITLREGETIRKVLQVNGAEGPAFFRASNLPFGAYLNPSTGLLEYTAGSDVALGVLGQAVYDVNLAVTTGSQTANAVVRLTVLDVNRAPKVMASVPDYLEVDEGSALSIFVAGAELDAQDAIALSLGNAAAVNRYPGGPGFFAAGLLGELRWTIPAGTRGSFPFTFFATDSLGAIASRTVTVAVVARNGAPVLTVPENTEVAAGEIAKVSISAADPEGSTVTFDFAGLPPGAVVKVNGNSADFSYNSPSVAGEQVRFDVSAFDGRKLSRATVKVNFAKGARPAGAIWPGAAGTPSATVAGFEMYDPSNGRWAQMSCTGVLEVQTQFGGFVGDQPLFVTRNGTRRHAVYRVIQGQGYWYIETDASTEVVPWGLAQDIPVPGDYDGDGTTDLVVYRPSTAQWFLKFSNMAPQVLQDTALGADSDAVRYPFADDVDGDKLDDRIIFSRKSDGSIAVHVWLATGAKYVFGLDKVDLANGFIPIVNDIDRDGRADFGARKVRGGFGALLSQTAAAKQLPNVTGVLAADAGCSQGGLALLSGKKLQLVGPQATIASEVTMPGTTDRESTVLTDSARRAYRFTKSNAPSQIAVFRARATEASGRWLERTAAGINELPVIRGSYGYTVSGDFFGEGAPRLGVFESGSWNLQRAGSVERTVLWGEVGDTAVPGDYNADGRDDIAVYRPEDGSWWIQYSGAADTTYPERLYWGTKGDVPVPGDYDGNGSTDLAVWRPATGEWFVRYFDGRVTVAQFGLPNDIPAPGEYTTPGQTNFAVFRPSEGGWYILSGSKTVQRQWGLPSDIPLRGDFDGNGRTDLAVFRPSDGTWYLRSLDSLFETANAVQFGLPGDLPLGGITPKRVF